jgi:hypothetical protein
MATLKFRLNQETNELDFILDVENESNEKVIAWARYAMRLCIQLNYTEIFIQENTVDMGASLLFSDSVENYDEYNDGISYVNDEAVFIELDLSKNIKVVGGLTAPSAIAANKVLSMLKLVIERIESKELSIEEAL